MQLTCAVVVALAACLAFAPTSDAVYGIDISLMQCESGVSQDAWNCLKNNLGDNAFAIIETWNGGYQFDVNIANCVAGAWAAGFAHVDVYAFMCNQCSGNVPPQDAVSKIQAGLQGVNFGMLWFDVEQCDGCWDSTDGANQFLIGATQQASSLGFNIGMYSSVYEWQQTVGGSTDFSNLPLWYAHYDNDPSFDDPAEYQFGGWTRPNIKQYNDQPTLCGVSVDWNWYPDSMIPWFKAIHSRNATAVAEARAALKKR